MSSALEPSVAIILTFNTPGEVNASNTAVDFAYEQVDFASVDEYGVVTFTSPGVLKVRIIATDGSNAEDTITIIAY